MAGPDPNNNTPNTESNAPDAKKEDFYIDPISLKLNNITEFEANELGYKVMPLTLEESYYVNKPSIGDMSPLEYSKMYKLYMEEDMYDLQKNRRYDSNRDASYDFLQKLTRPAYTKPGLPIQAHPASWGISPENAWKYQYEDSQKRDSQIGFEYGLNGTRRQTLNNEQIAESRREYFDPKANGGLGAMKNLEVYQRSNHFGSPYRYNEDGTKKMLVIDNASKMWVEVDEDDVIAGNQMRSVWGAKEKDSGFFQHITDSFYNGTTDLTTNMWGSLVETMGTMGNLLSGSEDVNSWQKWGRSVQNYGNAKKSKISEAAENEGMFGSWRAGLGTVSNMIPQLAAQAGIGWLTGGASAYVQALGKGGQFAARMMNGAPYMFGAIYAANGMNEEGKAAGLSANDRMVMNLLAGGAVFAAEKFTSKFLGATGIADGFANPASRKIVEQNMAQGYREVTKKFTPTILSKTATKAEKELAGNAAASTLSRYYFNGMKAAAAAGVLGKNAGVGLAKGIQSFLSAPIRWGYTTAPKSLKGRFWGAGASAWEEGWEEEAEKHMNYWFKEAYNAGVIGIDGPDKYAEPGRGMFDNTVHTKRFDEFFAGAIGGGIMGAIFGGRMKRTFSDKVAIEYALQYGGDADKADAGLLSMKESMGFGDKLTDANDNYISMYPEAERKNVKSKNDIAFEALREDVKRASQIIKTFGLTDPDKISRIAGGDMALVKDTVDNLLNAQKLSTEIEGLKNQLQNTDPADINYKELERQINEKQGNLKQINKLADDVLSGKAIENYRAQTLVRGLLVNNEYNKLYSEVEKETDPEAKRQKAQSVFDESITTAEKRDLWKDQEAALNLIYNGREMLEQFKKSKEIIEQRTKESNDFVGSFNDIDFTDLKSITDVLEKVNGNHLQEIVGQKIDEIGKKINDEQQGLQKELDNDFNSVRSKFGFDNSYTFDMLYNGTQNDEVDAEVENILNNKKDKAERFSGLSVVKNSIDRAKLLLKNKAPVKYTPGAGIDKKTSQWNNKDHFTQDQNAKKYKKITGDSEIEISESTFASMQDAAKMQGRDSFEYNGELYVAENTDQIKVNGKQRIDSALIDDPQMFNFIEIDDVNELFLQMPIPSGLNVREELNDIQNEFNETKVLTAQMKERLKEVNKQITDAEQILSVYNWVNLLADNKVLSEDQKEYFELNTYNEINKDAYAKKLAIDRALHINVAMATLSKDDRDNKLNELKDNIVKMQAQVYNDIVKELNGEDLNINGKVIVFPEELPLDASETEVMQAYQWMHYFIQNLTPEQKNEFKGAFDKFWNTTIESKNDIIDAKNQGMFLDGFDTMLDFDAFVAGYNNVQYNGDTNNSYRELFYYHAINMMMNVDPMIAFSAIANVIDEADVAKKFNLDTSKYPAGDHTAEQIMNVMIGITHLSENITRNNANADQSFIDLLDHVKSTMKLGTAREGRNGKAKGLYNRVKDTKTKKFSTSGKHIKDNVMSFFGYGGVGKSTFVIKTLAEIAKSMGKKNFVFIAPNIQQKEILEKSVKGIFSKADNVEFFIVSDFVKNQEKYKDYVIFADEISLYKDEEKNSIAFNYTKIGGKDISMVKKDDKTNVGFIDESNTVFLLGDTLQAPPSGEEYDNSPKIEAYTQHGFNITSVKRSSFIEIYKIQTAFRRNAKNNKLGAPELIGYSYSEDNNVKKGVKLNNDKNTFLGEAKTAVEGGNGYIIVHSEKEYNSIINEISSDKHDRVFIMTDIKKSPQGRTLDGEVYVYMPFSETVINSEYNSNKLYNMYMLTAVSRASTFVSVYTGDGLGNKNSILVSEDKIESFDDTAESKILRKQQLWSRISNVKKGLTEVKAAPVAAVKKDKKVEKTEAEDVTTQNEVTPVVEETKDKSKGDGVKSNSKTAKTPAEVKPKNKKRTNKNKNKEVQKPEDLTKEAQEPATIYEQNVDNQSDITEEELEGLSVTDDVGVDHSSVEASIDNGEFGLTIKSEDGTRANIVTMFVDGSPFVIAVGGVYREKDPTNSVKVVSIQIKEDGSYHVKTDKLKELIPAEKFAERYAKNPLIDEVDPFENALVTLTQTGVLTLFGKTIAVTDFLPSNNAKENARIYQEKAMQSFMLYKNLGRAFNIKIEILKNAQTIDWNGEINSSFPYLLQVSISNNDDYQYFTTHYIQDPNRANKTVGKSAKDENLEVYNNLLFNIVEKLYNNGKTSFETHANKNAISATSFIGFSEKIPVMSYNDVKKMVSQYGMRLTETIQKTTNGETQTYAIAYFDNPKTGQKIIFESVTADKMNDAQKDYMNNEVRQKIKILEDAIRQNIEGVNKIALKETDNLFAYNFSSMVSINSIVAGRAYTPIKREDETQEESKNTVNDRIKVRLEILNDLITYLSPNRSGTDKLKHEDIVSKFRLDTKYQSEGIVTGVEYLSTVKGLYLRMPVMDISANILLDNTAGLAQKIQNQKEYENYTSSFNEIQSELNDILGDGIQMGIIKSDLYHGFVDKLGKIHMNMHNGAFNMRTLSHEIVHYVDEFLLEDAYKSVLYDEVDKKYGISKKFGNWRESLETRRKIAEQLADDGDRYKSDRRNLKGVSKYMRAFFDWFNRFMSRIGIINDKINDFYYDLYIAKKFKSPDGTSLDTIREEMPYDSLYSRIVSPNDNFDSVAKNIFYDESVARSVANNVSAIIAKEVIMPSMNRRMFLDGTLSFVDIINRIENKSREKVMFVTDEKGDFVYEEQEIDGKKMRLPVIRDLMIDYQHTFLRWRFNGKDENGNTIFGLSLQYYNRASKGYVFAEPNAQGIFFTDKTERETFRRELLSSINDYEIETIDGLVNITDQSMSGKEKLKKIGNTDKVLYENAMLLNDSVFKVMVNRVFPTLDIETILNRDGKVRYDDILESLNRVQDANIRKEESEVNQMDRQSDIMKLILNNIPRYEFNNDATVSAIKGKKLNYVVANKILTDLHSNLWIGNSSDGIEAFEKSITNYINSVLDNVSQEKFFELNGDEKFISAFSIYKTFFDPQSKLVGQTTYYPSHARIYNWNKQLSKETRGTVDYEKKLDKFYSEYLSAHNTEKQDNEIVKNQKHLTRDEFELNLGKRAKLSETILNSMITHFGSLTTNKFENVKQFGTGIRSQFLSMSKQTSTASETKLKLEQSIISNIQISGGLMPQRYVDLFINRKDPVKMPEGKEKKSSKFLMTDIGIIYRHTEKAEDRGIVIVPIRNGNFANLSTTEIQQLNDYAKKNETNPSKIVQKVFTDFFNMGRNSGQAKQAANVLSTKKTGSDEYGLDNLSNVLAPIMASMYVYTVTKTLPPSEILSKQPVFPTYIQALENYAKNAGQKPDYGKISDATLDSMQDVEAGSDILKDGDKYFFPTGFYKELEALAKIMSFYENNPTIRSVDNRRKLYVIGNQHNFNYKYSNGTNENLANMFEEVVKGPHTNPNGRGSFVLNPILEKTSTGLPVIRSTPYMMGINSSGKSVELKSMSPQDNLHAALANFTKNENAKDLTYNISPVFIPANNSGNRGRQHLLESYFGHYNGGGNGFLTKQSIPGTDGKMVESFKLDTKNIASMMKRAFAIKEEAQINSLNRWINFLSNPANGKVTNNAHNILASLGITPINTSNPDYKYRRDNAVKFLVEYLKNNMPYIVEDDVIGFEGSKLRLGSDYLILKANKNDKGGKLYIGHDTSMMNKVLTTDPEGKTKFRTVAQKLFNYSNYNDDVNLTFPDGKIRKFKLHDVLRTNDFSSEQLYVDYIDDLGVTNRHIFNENDLTAIIDTFFGVHYTETNEIAIKEGYKMTSNNVFDLFAYEDKVKDVKGINIYGDVPSVIWKGLIIGHTMVNFFSDHAIEGTEAIHLSNVIYENETGPISYGSNRNKRALSHTSTGFVPSIKTHNGIDPVTKILVLKDLKVNASILTPNGEINKEHIIADGQSINSPFHMEMNFNSTGGNYGSLNRRVQKSIAQQFNYKDGSTFLKKHAGFMITKTMMDSSIDMANLFEYMMNPALRPVLQGEQLNQMSFLKKTDIDNLPGDNLYQRYLIYFDQTATEAALNKTLDRINGLGGIKTLLESTPKYKNNATAVETVLNDWKNSQFNDTVVGQYNFIGNILAGIRMDNLLYQEGEKDHNRAIEMLVDFYADYRAKNPETYQKKYPYISSIQFTGNKKDQTKEFEMPFVAVNKSAGATHADAEGNYNQGRPMPMFVKDGDAAPTNFYELVNYWKNQDEDAPYDMWTYDFDNTQEITQLNPERDIDDNEESPMVQAMSIILANPNSLNSGLAKEIATDLSSLMRVGLENVMRYITNDGKWSAEADKKIESLRIEAYKLSNETGIELSAAERNTIENFVKTRIKKSMSSTDDATMLSEIISDDEISLNVSHGAVTRAQQYVAAFLRKEAVKRKVDAMRLVQTAGNFIDIVEHKETGEVFMLSEAYKHAAKMGVSFDSLFDVNNIRGLKHTTLSERQDRSLNQDAKIKAIESAMQEAVAMNPENKKEIVKMFTKIKMRYLVDENLVDVAKGEAIVPAVMFKKFNIPSNTGLNEVFRLYGKKDGVVTEQNLMEASSDYNTTKDLVFSFVEDNIGYEMSYNKNGKPRVNVTYNQGQRGLNTYFELMFIDTLNRYLTDNYKKYGQIYAKIDKEMEVKHGAAYKAMKEGSLEKSVEDIKQEMNQRLQEESINFAKSKIAELVNKYTDAITSIAITIKDNIGMRTPSGPGSGFINNIVGFINDASSVGYVNTIKNLIDGSDQDVDQFTIYYLTANKLDTGEFTQQEYNNWKDKMKKEGNYDKLSNEEGKVINNRLIRHLQTYFSDVKNAGINMSAIDLDPVKKAADGTYKELFKRGDLAHNIGHSFVYRSIAMDGQAVGPFANNQKLQTLLYSGYRLNERRGINTDIYNFKINSVENSFGQIVEEYDTVPVNMEMLVNAATDNPKLLALGAMNITMNNSDMASAMMFAPKEIQDFMRSVTGDVNMTEVDAVLNFLKRDGNKDIFDIVKSNLSMYNGGYSKSYYNSAFNYYKSLQAHKSVYTEQYQKNLDENDTLFNSMLSFLMNDIGYDEVIINTALATSEIENKGDVLMSLIRQLNPNNISNEVRKKHAILKSVIDGFIANSLDDVSDNEFRAEIEKALDSTNVQDSFDIASELSNMRPSTQITAASEASTILSEKYKNYFKNLKKYKDNLFKNKNIAKKTDKNYVQEVYLITKYAMLGEIMSDMVKVANINQFKQSSAYENKKFEKDFTFATGYTIDEMLGIYDRFSKWKKDNGADSTIGQYFDSNPDEKKTLEAVRETAFQTKAHLLTDVDFSYMRDSIESPISDEVINYKEDYHKIFDFAEILLSRPDVMESLRASQMFKDINASIFNIESPEIQSMVNSITDDVAYDLLPEAKSITLKEEISKYFVHLYLSDVQTNGYASEVREDINNALKKFNILTLPMTSGSEMSNGMMHSIGNPIGVRNFIANFPEFFVNNVVPSEIQRLKDSETKFNAADLENAYKFLERVEKYSKNRMDYLEVQKSRQKSVAENEMLKDGFNKLSSEAQTLTSLYHILKNQFDTNKSFFGEVLPKKFLIDYTKFLKEKVPNLNIGEDLENIKAMILSNTNLDILKPEKRIYKEGKEYSMPPSSAYGVAKHYKKTIQVQDQKYSKGKIRTFALATTNGINGVALVQGSATLMQGSNIIPFNSVLNIYQDTDFEGNPILESFSYTPTVLSRLGVPMTYSLNLTPNAYIKNIVHGHLENDIKNAIARAEESNAELLPTDIMQIVDGIMSKDLNNVRYKKGIPVLKDKDTAMEVSKTVRKQTFDVVLRSLQKKYGSQLDAVLQSLDGKMIKDEYYYSDIASSYTLYAALNILKNEGLPFTLESLQTINEIPSIEIFNDEYGLQAIESEPLVNLMGTFGNYFTREDARSSGYVVKANMKGANGRGTKNVFYETVKDILQDTEIKKEAYDTLMANILIADSIGMSLTEMKNKINQFKYLDLNQVSIIYETALKTRYNHVDRNIDNDTMKRHSQRHYEISNLIENNKTTELWETIKQKFDTLVRYQETPYEVGDIINFPDGVRGIVLGVTSDNNVRYVINHKLTDSRNIFKAQRAVVSLENIMLKNNTRFALDGFVRTISGIMPDVEYRYVNDEEARQIQRSEHDSVSFYQDGIVYINVDKADRGVAIHEFAHPLTLAIQAENPELFVKIADLVSQSTAMDYVRRMYKDDLDTDEAMILEAIPTYIQFRYYARLSHEMSPEERATWEAFFAEANSIFKEALIGDVNAESSLDNVDFKTASLNSISDAILNDMLKGKEFVVRNKEAFNIARFLPYTMRASTASSVKNINLNNIDTLFQRKSHNTKDDKARRQIRDNIYGNTYSGLSGTYDLTMRNKEFYDTSGKYDQRLKEKYIGKIVENEMAFYSGIETNIIRFLDELKTFEPLTAAKQTLFASWNKRHDLANANEAQKEMLTKSLKDMMNKLGYNPNLDKAMLLKDAEKELGLKIPNGIRLDNTIVIVHNIGRPSQELSILNVSNEYLENHGIEKNNIAAAFIGENMTNKEKRKAKNLQNVTLSNDNGHIEAVKTSIIAMAVKKTSPGTVIRKIGAVHVNGNNLSVRSRDVDDTVRQVELLFDNIPQLKENLEVDIRDIVSDKSLYNMDLYKVPLGTRLLNYFRTLISTLKPNDNYKKSVQNTIDQGIKVFENGDNSYYNDMQKAVFGRIQFLREELGNDTARAANEEYQFLLQTFRELTGYNEINTQRYNELSWDEKMIQTADRWTGNIRTWLFDQIDLATRKGVDEMLPFNKELNTRTKTLNTLSGNILSYGLDKTHDLFKPLFKKVKGYDPNGNEVTVSTHEIHCDINDAETALALANNQITQDQLDFGKWLADSMYEEFVQYIMTVERKNISKKVGMTEIELRAAAEIEVSRRYKKGMMPVFIRSTGSALSEGKFMEAMDMYLKNAGRFIGGSLYEEFTQTEDAEYQKESFKKIMSPFWNQFQSAENYGGSFRMKLLGLDLKVRNQDTSIEIIAPEIQNSLSYNLQNIGNYTMMASKRTKHMQRAVASSNIAMDMLRGEEAMRGVNTKDAREHVENYVNRQIYGNLPQMPKVMLGNISVNIDYLLDASNRFINMAHLAIKPGVAAKNLFATTSKLIINSLINQLVGKNFNIVNVTRAAEQMFSNGEKIRALNEKYQIVNMSEKDLINHFQHVVGKANATEPDAQMILNWFGDYYNQLIGGIAQMINDGTYDAHDEFGNYDETKDKRFEGEDGEYIKNAIIQQQFKESYHVPVDGKMTHAYTQRQENHVRIQVQRFVGELTDPKYKNMASSYSFVRAATSMRSYMYNVAQAWWKNPSQTTHLGGFKVIEVDGVKESVWAPELTEGMINTLIYCAKGLRNAVKTHTFDDFKKMSSFQKRNLIAMATFTGIMAGVYLLADSLLYDEDRKKVKKYRYEKDPKTGKRKRVDIDEPWIGERLLSMLYDTKYDMPIKGDLSMTEMFAKNILLKGVEEQLSYVSPYRMFQDIGDMPSTHIMQADNVAQTFVSTLMLPWTLYDQKDIEGITNELDEYFYDLSKNMPFGGGYREVHDSYDYMLDYISESTKQ